MLLTWIIAAAPLVAPDTQAAAGATCLRGYFGLPARTPAEPAALRAAILRRYPAGTPVPVLRALGSAASRSPRRCAVTSTRTALSDAWTLEELALRPRPGDARPAALVELVWAPDGLRDVRIGLKPHSLRRD